MEKIIGYMQVLSLEETEDAQRTALLNYGVEEANLYKDAFGPRGLRRAGYYKMLQDIRPSDVVVIPSIDLLGTDYDEIMAQWRLLTAEKQADIVVLDMPLMDTRRWDGSSLGILVPDLILQILSYHARKTNTYTKQRQREGILAARKNGVRFGRPPKERPPHLVQIVQSWRDREISSREAASSLGVSQDTFLRWARQTEPTASWEPVQQ